jgi:hypothetical protein
MHADQFDRLGRPFGLPIDPKVVQPKKASEQETRLHVARHNNRRRCVVENAGH